MHLLRPYPDELLGSFLHRATRQLGLSSKRLMPLLSGATNATMPMFVTAHTGFALSVGMTLEELIQKHTLLPYMMAFMPVASRQRLLSTFLGGSSRSMSSPVAAQNASKGTAWLRLCTMCLDDDIQTFGDTYWRRVHQLPGVTMCVHHACVLHTSNINIRPGIMMRPPIEADSTASASAGRLGPDAQYCIAKLSEATLEGSLRARDWFQHYRSSARKLGYSLPNGDVMGEVISSDLLSYYGRRYLKTAQLDFEPGKRSAWPAFMFRTSNLNSTAAKHVLLNVFLASSPTPSKTPHDVLRRPRPARTDWTQVETGLLARMDKEVSQLKKAGTRITVKELLRATGGGNLLHHNRPKMPNLAAWIENFRTTAQSERQVGRRPRVYVKRASQA